MGGFDTYEEALNFVKPPKKETEWTSKILPKIKEVLNQIDAPSEWKKDVINAEKLEYSGKNALRRGTPYQSVIENYGDKWNGLMKVIGNQTAWFTNHDNPNKEYWFKYCEIMGKSVDYDFGDVLS